MNDPSHYERIHFHHLTSLLPEDVSFLGIGEGIKGIPPLVSRHLVPRCLLPRGAKGLPLTKDSLPWSPFESSAPSLPPLAFRTASFLKRTHLAAPGVPSTASFPRRECLAARNLLA